MGNDRTPQHMNATPPSPTINSAKLPHERRGVLLLIVLSMLTLFLMLGTAYLVVSTRSRETARAYARLAMQADDTRIPSAPLLDAAFLRLVRGGTSGGTAISGSNNRAGGVVQMLNLSIVNNGSAPATSNAITGTATQFESLLADKYGSSVRATAGSINPVTNAPLLTLGSVSIPSFPGASPGPAGLEQGTDLPGRVVTILGSGRIATSHRILRATVTSGSVTLVVDVPRTMTDFRLSRGETPIIINGPEYMIHDARDVTGALTGTVDATFTATNEPWDAFDASNPFLCRLLPAATVSSGTVLNVGFAPAASASVLIGATNGFAHGADNDGDGVVDGLFYDIGLPNYYKPNGDEVHIDVSALVVDLDSRFNVNAHGSLSDYMSSSGSSSLPAGWATGTAQTRVWDPATNNWTNGNAATPSLVGQPVGSGYGPAEVNGGWMFAGSSNSPGGQPESYGLLTLSGVAQGSLTGVRPSGSRFTTGASTPKVASLEGRYGEGGASRFATTSSYGDLVTSGTYQLSDPSLPLARPGAPRTDDTVSQFSDRGVNTTATGGTFNGGPPSQWWDGSRTFNWISTGTLATRAAYNSPPDLHGRMITTTSTTSSADVVPQLSYAKTEWGATETTDDPYEIRLDPAAPRSAVANTGSTTGDNVFSVADLEPLLRPYDADSFQLPQRLAAMLGSAAEEARLRVTTDSWDTTAITGTSAANIREWLRAAAGVTPLHGTSSVTGLIGGEIARGEKFNLNRPFTSPKPLAYSATDPYYSQRQAYFKDLYTLMVAVTGTAAPPDNALKAKYAQWAANVVEFRDDDSTMTPFEYDINPANGWSVNGDVLTDEGGDRRIVWGAERPEVLIAATSAWEDSSIGEMFVLLHRPWNAVAFSRNGGTSEAVAGEPIDVELDVAQGATGKNLLNLSRKSGSQPFDPTDTTTYPVWRLRIDDGSGNMKYVRFDISSSGTTNELVASGLTRQYQLAVNQWECVRGANTVGMSVPGSSNPTFNAFLAPGPKPTSSTPAFRSFDVYLERLSDPRAAITGTTWTNGAANDDPVVNGGVPMYRIVDRARMEVLNREPPPMGTAPNPTVIRRSPAGLWPLGPLAVGSGTTSSSLRSTDYDRASGGNAMWLPWNNRPFVSSAELFLVPASKNDGSTNSKDALGLLSMYTQPISTASLPALSGTFMPNGLLDAVHVPTRFAGIHTTTGTAAEPGLTSAGIFADTLWANQLSSYREPGRVNLNTVTSDDVWNAVVAGPLQTSGTAAAVKTRTTADFASNPAKAMHHLLSLSGTSSVLASGTVPPVQDTHTKLAAAAALNPAHLIYTATRLANTTTTRSNVYGVWITVRESVANDPDSIRLHRAFYVFDRSIPVGFEPGQDHNVWDAVLLRRIIQ
jgi:hypothetical protein